MLGLAALLDRVRRAFTGPPISRLDELQPGTTATVRGVVVPRDLIDCPLSGEACVYYRYAIERWRRSRVVGVSGDGFWEAIERDEAIAEFYLADPTRPAERVVVAPQRAAVSLARGLAPREHRLDDDRRATEVLIRPGDRVEITATVAEVHDLLDESRSYRTPAQRLMLTSPTIVVLG